MKKFFISMILVCLVPAYVRADVYVDDFSGDLSQWTAGPSHLNSYGIVGDQLRMDGYGHLADPGNGGWGVLQFNRQLGSNFVATWDARITRYDYANFTLSADSPWAFNSSLGYTDNGYVGWLDINDPTNPLLDVMKRSGGSALDLPAPQRDIAVTPDIANGQWFSWKVAMNRGQLSVYIDDTLYIDTYDPEFANSNYKIGFGFGEDSQGYVDNFQVTVVPIPGSVLLGMLGLIVAGMKLRKYA